MQWFLQERNRRRIVFLPSFSRTRPGSSLMRQEAAHGLAGDVGFRVGCRGDDVMVYWDVIELAWQHLGVVPHTITEADTVEHRNGPENRRIGADHYV